MRLHWGHVEILRALIERGGADVNADDEDEKYTAVHVAVEFEFQDLCKYSQAVLTLHVYSDLVAQCHTIFT